MTTIRDLLQAVRSAEFRLRDQLPETLRDNAAVLSTAAEVAVVEDGRVSIPAESFLTIGTVREVAHPATMSDAFLVLEVGVVSPAWKIEFRFRGNNGMAIRDATKVASLDGHMVTSVPRAVLTVSAPEKVEGLRLRLRKPDENKRLYGILDADPRLPGWFKHFVVEGTPPPPSWDGRPA